MGADVLGGISSRQLDARRLSSGHRVCRLTQIGANTITSAGESSLTTSRRVINSIQLCVEEVCVCKSVRVVQNVAFLQEHLHGKKRNCQGFITAGITSTPAAGRHGVQHNGLLCRANACIASRRTMTLNLILRVRFCRAAGLV